MPRCPFGHIGWTSVIPSHCSHCPMFTEHRSCSSCCSQPQLAIQQLQSQSAAHHPAEGWKHQLTFWFPRDPSRPSVGGFPGGARQCCEDRWMCLGSQHGLREHCLPGSEADRWCSRICQLSHKGFNECSENTTKRPLRARTCCCWTWSLNSDFKSEQRNRNTISTAEHCDTVKLQQE